MAKEKISMGLRLNKNFWKTVIQFAISQGECKCRYRHPTITINKIFVPICNYSKINHIFVKIFNALVFYNAVNLKR